MDQVQMVSPPAVEGGAILVKHLRGSGFPVEVAFWAVPEADGAWFLYLATPEVAEKGLSKASQEVHRAIRALPESWVEPLEVRCVPPGDPMAVAAAAAIEPKVATGQFAVSTPKPRAGVTNFGGRSLGGVAVGGAVIYPPEQTAYWDRVP